MPFAALVDYSDAGLVFNITGPKPWLGQSYRPLQNPLPLTLEAPGAENLDIIEVQVLHVTLVSGLLFWNCLQTGTLALTTTMLVCTFPAVLQTSSPFTIQAAPKTQSMPSEHMHNELGYDLKMSLMMYKHLSSELSCCAGARHSICFAAPARVARW